jgi:predicted nucleic acid-binding Zn ribbon protein
MCEEEKDEIYTCKECGAELTEDDQFCDKWCHDTYYEE